MGDRALASVLFICALPEALPLSVAGVSAILGIPLMMLTFNFQMITTVF